MLAHPWQLCSRDPCSPVAVEQMGQGTAKGAGNLEPHQCLLFFHDVDVGSWAGLSASHLHRRAQPDPSHTHLMLLSVCSLKWGGNTEVYSALIRKGSSISCQNVGARTQK